MKKNFLSKAISSILALTMISAAMPIVNAGAASSVSMLPYISPPSFFIGQFVFFCILHFSIYRI